MYCLLLLPADALLAMNTGGTALLSLPHSPRLWKVCFHGPALTLRFFSSRFRLPLRQLGKSISSSVKPSNSTKAGAIAFLMPIKWGAQQDHLVSCSHLRLPLSD
jgi:hypothetical protein